MAISNGYCTLSDIKDSLRIIDSVDDSLLELAVESASRAIDGYAQRSFYSSGTAVRYYAAVDEYLCNIDDTFTSAPTVESAPDGKTFNTTWKTSDYQLEPLNGVVDGLVAPYTRIRAVGDYAMPVSNGKALMKITAVWGYTSVPVAIKQACIIQASRFFKRLESPLGVAGFGDLGAISISRDIDPDVAQMVHPFQKRGDYA